MNPMVVGHEMEENLKSLLRTQFPLHPEQPPFRHLWDDFFSAFERALKGPYLQLPLPFAKAKGEQERSRFAPAMEQLPYSPYRHQVQAFERIAAPHFMPTIVATGTGSGKTECFTYPILSYCAQFREQLGIRAIIIYPMNALATDQARRLAETINKHPGLRGVRVGLYIGENGQRVGRDLEMGPDHVITDREAILQAPPHILLTNYKMLDYMLLRERERPLWERNDPTTLKYLVVDELHTFDGAQAADLACLIRRLKLRLRMKDTALCCIGTSATLGGGEGALEEICDYAGAIFSREFTHESIIPESRLTFAEMKDCTGDSFFNAPCVEALFEILGGQIKPLDEVAGELHKRALVDSLDEARQRVRAICQELSTLRAARGRDYPEVRLQYWLREQTRMVASLPQHASCHAHLEFSDDLSDPQHLWDESNLEGRYADTQGVASKRVNYFPVRNCNLCGATGWVALMQNDQCGVKGPLKEIYAQAFAPHAGQLVYLYPLVDECVVKAPQDRDCIHRLCPSCLKFLAEDKERCDACCVETLQVLVVRPREAKDPVCPFCGADHEHQLFVGMRSSTLLASCISSMNASPANTDKKMLAFSDNVQDASFRAGFFGARTWAATFRSHLAHYFQAQWQQQPVPFVDFVNGFWPYLEGLYREDAELFGALIPEDLKWHESWLALTGPHATPPSKFALALLEARLKWEIALELGCKSGYGRTLKQVGICELKANLPTLENPCWQEMFIALGNANGQLRRVHKDPGDLRATVERLAAWMIAHGAFEDAAHVLTGWTLPRGGQSLREYSVRVENRAESNILRPVKLQGSDLVVPCQGLRGQGGTRLPREVCPDLDEAALCELFQELANREIVKAFTRKNANECYWFLPLERLVVTPSVPLRADNPFRRQYLEGALYRLNPAEHTGLLKRNEREALERAFKASDRHTWQPNLLSATPTLEMGVDIGDLSSVLLCSVPPTQSRFVQRMGRAGRANGSALSVVIANAKAHDLYFFEDPQEMISGAVSCPGVFLDAVDILSRQYVGYVLSEWMLAPPYPRLPQTVGEMFTGLAQAPEQHFPNTFFSWYRQEQQQLFKTFHASLRSQLARDTAGQLQAFASADAPEGIIARFSAEVARTRETLDNYTAKQEALQHRQRDVREDHDLTEQARAELLEALKVELKSYTALKRSLRGQLLVAWLSDTASLLPNYAFPEPGVFLQSVLWRKKQDNRLKFTPYEVSRPASSGLTELVPGSEFFSHGHHVEINQVDLQKYKREELEHRMWRFCPNCDHLEPYREDQPARCPVCQTVWADGGQLISMLPTRQFISVQQSAETLNTDASEQRQPKYYDTRKFFERSDGVRYRCESDELPFGFEYLPHLTLREVNFGLGDAHNQEGPSVNGQQIRGNHFQVCPECGKAFPTNAEGPFLHLRTCARNRPANAQPEQQNLDVCFYREYKTEALRIFIPAFEENDQVTAASLMAALQLGLKLYFHGQVDHLQMERQSLPDTEHNLRNQYIIVYDSVPGGTGYLKQFVAEQDKPTLLFEVLKRALEHLTHCTCGLDPDLDGCYRCLYRFRDPGARQNVSRRAAIDLLSRLVPLASCVCPAPDEHIYKPSAYQRALESELERIFDQRLRKAAKGDYKEGLTQAFQPGMRITLPGNQLPGGDDQPKTWEVVPQRAFGAADGVIEPCKPDFLFLPIDNPAAKPVAVFTDGWQFHQHLTDQDIRKRVSLMKAGYRVWSLTWEDVVEGAQPAASAWRKEVCASRRREQAAAHFLGDAVRAEQWRAAFDGRVQAFDRLLCYLQVGNDERFCAHARYCASLLVTQQAAENRPALPTGWSTFLEGRQLCELQQGAFSAYVNLRQDRSLRVAAILADDTPPEQASWQAFLDFVNVLQFLGENALFYTTKSMANALWQQVATLAAAPGEQDAWAFLCESLAGDAQLTAIVRALQDTGVPPPDPEPFSDYADAAGAVVCSMWLKWEAQRVCLLGADDPSPPGWTAISVGEETPLETLVTQLIGALPYA